MDIIEKFKRHDREIAQMREHVQAIEKTLLKFGLMVPVEEKEQS